MDYYGYTNLLGTVNNFFIFYIMLLLIMVAVIIIQIIAFWEIFKKAGKGGWEAIVPFYNDWVLVEISGLNWWWFLILLSPLVLSFIGLGWIGYAAYIFASFNCYYNLCKKFNKGVGFAICLTLFTPICASMLAFSKDEVYDNNVSVSNNGIFDDNNSNNNTNIQQSVNNVQKNNEQPMEQIIVPTLNVVSNEQTKSVLVPEVQPLDYMNVKPQMNEDKKVEKQKEPETNQTSKTCSNCGYESALKAKFCVNCGNQL